MFKSVVISSGHGLYVRGATGVLDEVTEARRVVDKLAEELKLRNVAVKTFHDDTSKSQNENLSTIVNYHNAQQRELDISVHFNAYVETTKGMGVECLYLTQHDLASQVAGAVASVGLINRGPKKRTDLYFLNKTEMPSILLETCFVDSTVDADIYNAEFAKICDLIAGTLGGAEGVAPIVPPVTVTPRVDVSIAIEGDVIVSVNGQVITVVGHGR